MNLTDEPTSSNWYSILQYPSNKTEITIDGLEMVTFSMAVISIPFYISFLLFLIRNHNTFPFDSQYFTISISEGISDLILLNLTYICFKFPSWAWIEPEFYVNLPTWVPKIAIGLTFRSTFAQMLGVVLLSFNRFVRLVWPHRYERLCNKKHLRIYLAMQWIIPWALVAPMLLQEFRFKKEKDLTEKTIGVKIEWSNGITENLYIAIAGTYSIVCNLASALMYFIIFAQHFFNKRTKVQPETGFPTAELVIPKMEFNLAIASFLIYLVMLSNSIEIIRKALAHQMMLSSMLSDAVCYCNPYFICLACKQVRQKLKYFVLCLSGATKDYETMKSDSEKQSSQFNAQLESDKEVQVEDKNL